jgi:tRNA (guanine10-N2)-methyltransferase
MLDDILNFATDMLVDNGRLSFWVPTANDEEQEIAVPTHPCLELVVVCTQVFNKCESSASFSTSGPPASRLMFLCLGSRRLITYRRLPDAEIDKSALAQRKKQVDEAKGRSADDLNPFRRHYFRGFKSENEPLDNTDTAQAKT